MTTCKSSASVPLIIIFMICACQRDAKETLPPFESDPRSFPVNTIVMEASGLADSKRNPGYLWVHEDSGTPPRLYLVKHDGVLLKTVFIDGANNVDWEDMSLSNGPDLSLDYVYLADIGDNQQNRAECVIYRFPEPASAIDTVRSIEKLRFKYPTGAHDAEAMFVDNTTRDIYIVTKSDDPAQIFKISYPQSTSSVNQAVLAGKLAITGVTGAAISADGKEIIIKTYPALSYYVRNAGEKIEESLIKNPLNLKYQLEPQGEAVAFAADNSGFYTLSEKAFASTVNLYFYKRK